MKLFRLILSPIMVCLGIYVGVHVVGLSIHAVNLTVYYLTGILFDVSRVEDYEILTVRFMSAVVTSAICLCVLLLCYTVGYFRHRTFGPTGEVDPALGNRVIFVLAMLSAVVYIFALISVALVMSLLDAMGFEMGPMREPTPTMEIIAFTVTAIAVMILDSAQLGFLDWLLGNPQD